MIAWEKNIGGFIHENGCGMWAQSLPQTISFIKVVLSHQNVDRDTLIQEELRSRRWQFPRNIDSHGEVEGYGIVLQGEIEQCKNNIAQIEARCHELRLEKQQIGTQLKLLCDKMLSLEKMFGAVYRLIDILGYQDRDTDYAKFQDLYEQTYIRFEEPKSPGFSSHFFSKRMDPETSTTSTSARPVGDV